jgi:hypothetical protein
MNANAVSSTDLYRLVHCPRSETNSKLSVKSVTEKNAKVTFPC